MSLSFLKFITLAKRPDKSREGADEISTPWNKLAKTSLYLLTLLLPLFFLPGAADYLGLPKQLLLLLFVFVGFVFWLLDAIYGGKITFNRRPLLCALIVFLLLAWGISTFFSYSKYGSFWGWPLDTSESFLTLILLVATFFLVSNVFTKKSEAIYLLMIFVLSSSLAVIFGFTQAVSRFILPFGITKAASFTTVGSLGDLAIFVAPIIPLAIGLAFSTKNLTRKVFAACALTMLILLLAINSLSAWIVLLLSSVILLALTIGPKGQFKAAYVLAIILVAISVLFILIRRPLITTSAPTEINLTYRATLNINQQTLVERLITGTGPGTFVLDYSKFKNSVLNQSPFWNTRFMAGSSKIIDAFGTAGILGGASFVLLLLAALYFSWRVAKSSLEGYKFLVISTFASLVGSIAVFAFSRGSLSSQFSFWLVFGSLCAIGSCDGKKVWSLEAANKASMIISLALVVTIIAGIGLGYFGIQRFMAQIDYVRGLTEFSKGNANGAIEAVNRAIGREPKQSIYWRDIAQMYSAKALNILQAGQVQNMQAAAEAMSSGVNAGKTATDLDPKTVANWMVRGFIYQGLIGSLKGAEDTALQFGYNPALELEPKNPFIATSIGRIYLQKSILLANQKQTDEAKVSLDKAEEYLNKALNMKPDFAPANFNLATVYQLKGNADEAVKKLEQTQALLDPQDPDYVGLAFQLGVVYYQRRDYSKAKAEFEAAVATAPNYSNARYFLGLIYDQANQKDKAIEQFAKIADLNPDNQEVKNILSNLKSGKPALEGLIQSVPPKTPIEEGKPLEIK